MLPVTIGKKFFPGIKIPLLITGKDLENFLETVESAFLIIFADKGSGIIGVDGINYPFITPSVFYFNDRQSINITKQNDLHAAAVFFQPAIINDAITSEMIYDEEIGLTGSNMNDLWLLRQLFSNSGKNHHTPGLSSSERISLLIHELDRQINCQDDSFWPCRARSFFIELLILLERISFQGQSIMDDLAPSKDIEEIYPVILYMNSRYNTKISIADLAKNFNTNRTTLTEKFVKATGLPPIKYLIKLRVKIASQLLQDTSIPVNEIIERTGFDDPTHFGRMFKKYAGATPSSYRDKFTVPKYVLA